MVAMVSPVKGYASSEYGYRTIGGKRVFHAGLDIATGGVSAPVYAIYDGTIEKIVRNREPGQSDNVGTIAPYRTGNAPKVRNPDREVQVYGHVMTAIGWRVGDKIKAGQLLGYTDLSGNTSGHHCHLEIWNSNGTTRNPRIDFRAFGVPVGSAPKAIASGRPPYPHRQMTETNTLAEIYAAYKVLLTALGYTTPHMSATGLMQTWLKAMGQDVGPIDGDFGPRSKRALQRRLSDKTLRRPYTGPIDGRWGGVGSGTRIAASALLNDRITYAKG